MTEEESQAVAAIVRYVHDGCMKAAHKFGVKMYLQGIEDGKQGIEASSEMLLEILDSKVE